MSGKASNPATRLPSRLNLGVLVSGRGSTLQALIDACAAPDYPARIVLVLSNVASAAALERAAKAGIATAVLEHKTFPSREVFDEAMRARLVAAGADLVCLAGFMRLLSPAFVEAFAGRLINIHPSLLPAFPGLHVHENVLASGVRFTGCSVHFVSAEMDAGPIIVQAAVPVDPSDTAESLGARVIGAEHQCYPLAVRWIAEGRVRINGVRVEVDGAAAAAAPLINPQPTSSISAKK
ncbi:MAG: phosphoribosylglycinamide formyltransferase [Alphaproteobacteria bacterium]|nr:phosphoribosylglycinamide formyltransferase [Alphaproteobacteria bacterium]